MNPNKAIIITPPFYSPDFPQLGPAVIKGYLQAFGCDCQLLDLNIEFRDYLMEKLTIHAVTPSVSHYQLKEIKDTLLYYFTQRFVAQVGLQTDYLRDYFGMGSGVGESVEQYNEILNCGLGLTHLVNSRPDLLARFVQDRESNFYYSFIEARGFVEQIVAQNRIIGFSILSMTQVVAALTLAYAFKQVNPGVLIVLGGPWVTLFAGELAQYQELFQFYDILVQGEGEQPFLQLLQAAGKDQYRAISNLWVKEGNGFVPPVAFFRVPMQELPAPNYDGLPLRAYRVPLPVLVQGSRGCYWARCAFCVHTAGVHSYLEKSFRVRPLALLLEDIDTMVRKYNPRFLVFADVSMTPVICRQLSEAFIERNYRFRWFVFLRFEVGFTLELFQLMERANCLMINFGLESASQRILDKIEKGIQVAEARRILAQALACNFQVTLHTMAGLPGETAADLQETIAFIQEFLPQLHESFTEIFRLERDTRIFMNPAQFQITISGQQKMFDNAISFVNELGISSGQALKYLNETLYVPYSSEKELIYAAKSFASLKAARQNENQYVIDASFAMPYKEKGFQNSVRVTTSGGGLLHRL